jgi:hypothetical protein
MSNVLKIVIGGLRNTWKKIMKLTQAVNYLFIEYKTKVIKIIINYVHFYVCFKVLFNYADSF